MTMELHKTTDRVLDSHPDWAEICKRDYDDAQLSPYFHLLDEEPLTWQEKLTLTGLVCFCACCMALIILSLYHLAGWLWGVL